MSEKVDYLTLKEASKVLGVIPLTLMRKDNAGKLKTRRHSMNNYRIYDLAEVEALRNAILGGNIE